METVALVGVGLIGASFGLALRRAGFSGRIIGVSSPNAIRAGLTVGAISEEASLSQAVSIADLVYLAQPVDRILETLEKIGPLVHPDCLVTDAGSTKAAIVSKASQHLPSGIFLGGHPIAGKEQSGAEAAEATLFRNRFYVLTPTNGPSPPMNEFQEWLLRIGADIVQMSPTEHDTVIAATSHLPQLLSTALSATLSAQDNPRFLEVFGPGLLDMTRLAMSSPAIWSSILETNREQVVIALQEFIENLQALSLHLQSGYDLSDLFASGQKFATRLRGK